MSESGQKSYHSSHDITTFNVLVACNRCKKCRCCAREYLFMKCSVHKKWTKKVK